MLPPNQIPQSPFKAETYAAHIRLTAAQLAGLDALVGAGSFLSRSDAIRTLIREGLQRHGEAMPAIAATLTQTE